MPTDTETSVIKEAEKILREYQEKGDDEEQKSASEKERARSSPQKREQKPAQTIAEWQKKVDAKLESIFQKQGLENPREHIAQLSQNPKELRKTLDVLSLEEVDALLNELKDIPKEAASPEVVIYEKQLADVALEKETRRRGAELMPDAQAFNEQLFQRFAGYLSNDTQVTYGGNKLEVSHTADGVLRITLPKPTIENMVDVARQLELVDFKEGGRAEFGQQLMDAALLMDQQGIFSAEAIEDLYNAGYQIRDPEAEEKFNLGAIQERARNRIFTDADKQNIFLNLLMGRHPLAEVYDLKKKKYTTTSDSGKRTIYDVYFERWKRSDGKALVTASLEEQQQAYDKWLLEGNRPVQIMRLMKRFVEEKVTPGGQQDKRLGVLLAHWRSLLLKSEAGIKLQDQIDTKIANLPLSEQGRTEAILTTINSLFQPDKSLSADMLQYMPAEVLKIFQIAGDSNERNVAACVIASAYVKDILEQQGFRVFSDLNGNHMRLVAIGKDGDAFYVDPNIGKVNGQTGVVRIGDRALLSQFGDVQEAGGLLKVINVKRDVHIDADTERGSHGVISSGNNAIISGFLSNMGVLGREGKLPDAWDDAFLRLNFLQAVKRFPDNAMAWLLLSEHTEDREKKEEYYQKALRLNPNILQLAKSSEYKIGLPLPDQGRVEAAVDNGDREEIVKIIEELDPAERGGSYAEIVRFMMERALMQPGMVWPVADYSSGHPTYNPAAGITPGPRQEGLARYIVEFGLERIIRKADNNPSDPYPQFDMYVQSSISGMGILAEAYDYLVMPTNPQDSFASYISSLQRIRQATHELFRSMLNKDQFNQGITDYLKREGLSFLEHSVIGVNVSQRFYEKLWRRILVKRRHLPFPEDFDEADKELRGDFLRMGRNNQLLDVGGNGPVGDIRNASKELSQWQLDRAAVLGKGLSALSQRRLVFAVTGDIPSNGPDFLKSVEGEFIARALGGLKLIPKRFFGWAGAQKMIDHILDGYRQQDGGRLYGLLRRNDKGEVVRYGLYGQSEASQAILDTGVSDPKSNSWRAQLLLLRQPNYKTETISGQQFAIGDYLDRIKAQISNSPQARALKGEKKQEYIDEQFNEEIEHVIRSQRLFLGTLIRYAGIDNVNKAYIWKNIAALNPSVIAGFLPEDTTSIVTRIGGFDRGPRTITVRDVDGTLTNVTSAEGLWDILVKKLAFIEEQRVKEDSIILNSTMTDAQKLRELNIAPPAPVPAVRDLDYYFHSTPPGIVLTGEEINIIKGLQKLGMQWSATDENGDTLFDLNTGRLTSTDIKAGFARIYFPFTAFQDDVPETNWDGIEVADLPRILLSDQAAFEKGLGPIIGLIEDPGLPIDAVEKHMEEAFNAIKSPMGDPAARKKMRVYARSYALMAKSTLPAKWFGIIMQLTRQPRSEIEEENLQAGVARNEKEIYAFLTKLAAKGVIADDPTEKEDRDVFGKHLTAYEALTKELGADKFAVFLMWLRVIILLLGPVAAVSFAKAIFPELEKLLK